MKILLNLREQIQQEALNTKNEVTTYQKNNDDLRKDDNVEKQRKLTDDEKIAQIKKIQNML